MKFSIVIPTCGRPDRLRECLRRIVPQRGGNEIIVTDDGEGARRVAGEFPEVRWAPGPRRGPAANRNSGARLANGDWLVFLDDDCLPEPGWLAAYGRAAAEGIDILEGRTECPMKDRFGFYEIVENLTGGAFWSCNLAVRRDPFAKLGGFDEDFTEAVAEDMELAWRMGNRGLKSLFVRDARVTHPPRRAGPAQLLKRRAAHRWALLYRLKTGQGPGPEAPAAYAVAELVAREYLDNFRMFSHLRRRGEGSRPAAAAAEALWRWISLPWFLPYYIYWLLRFRRKCGRASRGGGALEGDWGRV